jgi:hypothetical protein
MRTTFLIAQRLGVSPFDIMEQDLEWVIMVVNYILQSVENKHENSPKVLSEKEADEGFWSAL